MALSALSQQTFHGSGSRDLYPDGVAGGRAKLRASTLVSAEATPFPTLGVHYVYAQAGEIIAMASSVQGLGSGRIRITPPTGSAITSPNNSTGRIAGGLVGGITTNRDAEKAGPRLPGSGSGGGYIPWTHTAATTGVYKVEFISGLGEATTDEGNATNDPGRANIAANANWTQANNTIYIQAWDISVSNAAGTQWISGRTWTNVLNMDIFSITQSGQSWIFSNVGGFYGKAYVLTKDGYVYRVDNNGNNGITFSFFSNNNGFVDANNEPTYLSNISAAAADFTHDPRTADANGNITNKIFYSAPDPNLPAIATGQGLPGGETWLRVERIPPSLISPKIIGYDGTEGQISNKGGHFYFETDNLASRYTITISPPVDQPGLFAPRTLTGPAQEGENWIPWDGKDGNGDDLPPGYYGPQVGVSLQTAEVHFPYIDMELNPNGIKIELLSTDYNTTLQDNVFWNDTNIPTGGVLGSVSSPINASHTVTETGESSITNGHRWGVGTTSTTGSFGDVRAMDTWTFVQGATQVSTPEILVAQSDVETISITSDHSGVVNVGDSWNYTIQVRNNGSMDIKTNIDPGPGELATGPASFMLYVPPGVTLDPVQATFFSTTCGLDESNNPKSIQIMGTPTFVNGVYIAELDMPVGCVATFTIPVSAVSGIQTGNGYVNVWATMLRPDDFTDIDATNPFPDKKPEDPFFEADGIQTAVDGPGGLGDDLFLLPSSINTSQTNNIKLNNQPYMLADMQVVKTVNPPSGHNSEDPIVFTIVASNNGPSDATNVKVQDLLTDRYTYITHTASTGSYNQATGEWDIDNLANGASATLTLTAMINPSGAAQVNIATVTADEYDPDPDNNQDDAVTDAEFDADLEIIKTGTRTGNSNGNASFTLTVRNNGPAVAAGVVVTDNLTTRYNFATPESNHTASHGSLAWAGDQNRNLTWTIGALAVDEVATLTFITTNNANGTRANTATVTADNPDPVPANNSSTLSEPINTGAPVDLGVTKTVDKPTPLVGEEVTFTITLTRVSGSDAVNDVVVTDVLPAGFAYSSHTASQGTYNPNTGQWSVGTVANATPRTLTLKGHVNPPTGTSNEYRNVASITAASRSDTNLGNNIAEASVLPQIVDLSITKNIDDTTPDEGQPITFTVSVTNHGPANASGVIVYDKLPDGYNYTGHTAGTGTYNESTGVWNIGTLNNSATVTLTINATVNGVGQYVNSAEVSGTLPEMSYINNSAQVIVIPTCLIRNVSPKIIPMP